MRLSVIAIGRLKAGLERDLAERYRLRLGEIGRALGLRGLDLHELPESRARDAATRMNEEAAAMRALIPEGAMIVALDERGDNISSSAFAARLGQWRDQGAPSCAFVIGGADGLAPDLRKRANCVWAFGAATWPHQFVRVMVYEQLYRAATILAGHPYHRA